MRISIAMATYNGARFLQEQLDSFLYQTRHPDELVVCDDGSGDATLSILETFRVQAPFDVRIHRNESRLGYARNFERALSCCTGDIIFLSDQDDVWFCNKIADIEHVFHQRRDAFVTVADMVLTDEEMTPTPYTQLGNIRASGHRDDGYNFGCGTALRSGFLDLVIPLPCDATGHDNWIHRLAAALGVRFVHEEPLQYYRRHTSNASQWLASIPRRITQIDSFRAHGLRDCSIGWLQEKQRVVAACNRVAESSSVLERLRLTDRQQTAMRAMQQAIADIDSRIECVKLPRLKRFSRVLGRWIQGRYRRHSGWKSAVKDVIRP